MWIHFFADVKESEPFKSGTLFLPRFQIVKKNKNCCLIVNYPLDQGQDKSYVLEQIKQKVNNIDWSSLKRLDEDDHSFLSVNRQQSQDPNYFKTVVKSVLSSIAAGELSKIVLAYTTEIKSAIPFDVIKSLSNLRKLHPDCYIFPLVMVRGKTLLVQVPNVY